MDNSNSRLDDENDKTNPLDSVEAESNISSSPAKAVAAAKSDHRSEVYDWLQCIVVALVAALLLFIFVGKSIDVLGHSMDPTLAEGDRIIISKLFYTPKQGDIVVLHKESFEEMPVVKRIVAVEGQTIDIDFDEGLVYVDGEALIEPYVNSPTYEQLDFIGPKTVPEGCVFVLGDNRNRSKDSRHADLDMVDTRYILGRLIFRMLPISEFGAVD